MAGQDSLLRLHKFQPALALPRLHGGAFLIDAAGNAIIITMAITTMIIPITALLPMIIMPVIMPGIALLTQTLFLRGHARLGLLLCLRDIRQCSHVEAWQPCLDLLGTNAFDVARQAVHIAESIDDDKGAAIALSGHIALLFERVHKGGCAIGLRVPPPVSSA